MGTHRRVPIEYLRSRHYKAISYRRMKEEEAWLDTEVDKLRGFEPIDGS